MERGGRGRRKWKESRRKSVKGRGMRKRRRRRKKRRRMKKRKILLT